MAGSAENWKHLPVDWNVRKDLSVGKTGCIGGAERRVGPPEIAVQWAAVEIRMDV